MSGQWFWSEGGRCVNLGLVKQVRWKRKGAEAAQPFTSIETKDDEALLTFLDGTELLLFAEESQELKRRIGGTS